MRAFSTFIGRNHGNFARIDRKATPGFRHTGQGITILCMLNNSLYFILQSWAEFQECRDPIPFTPLSKEKKTTSKA
jgi:hypothetical protein